MVRVRIQRKRKSDAQMMLNWARLLTLFARVLWWPWIDHERSRIQEAKYQNLQVQAQLNQRRAEKESNNVVIGDLRIEKLKMENELLKVQLARHGIGTNFKADNYSSDRE